MHTFKSTIKMNNPDKLETQGQKTYTNKITTQYVLDTTRRKQTQITQIRHELKIIH